MVLRFVGFSISRIN